MKSSDDVKRDSSIISIIEICGIHFSAKNFKVLIELKQLMLLEPPPEIDETAPLESPESPFNTCLIQPNTEECSELNLSDSNVEHVLEDNKQEDDFKIEKINLEPDEQLVEPELEFIDLDELSKSSTRETHGDDELATIKNTALNASATPNTVNNNDTNIESQLKLDSNLANLDDLGAVSLDVNDTPELDNSNIQSVKTPSHDNPTNVKIDHITKLESLDHRNIIEDYEDEHKIINNPSLINDPLTLKPRAEIINEMYSNAKDEMDRLKHEFIAATLKFENLKKEYGLN